MTAEEDLLFDGLIEAWAKRVIEARLKNMRKKERRKEVLCST